MSNAPAQSAASDWWLVIVPTQWFLTRPLSSAAPVAAEVALATTPIAGAVGRLPDVGGLVRAAEPITRMHSQSVKSGREAVAEAWVGRDCCCVAELVPITLLAPKQA
jgi:hypothetical protein